MTLDHGRRPVEREALMRWFTRVRWRQRLLVDFVVTVTDNQDSYLFLAVPCDGFHGLVIDLRPSGWRLPTQSPTIEMLRGQGYRVDVCTGWDSARTSVERYLGRFGTLQERG